MKELKTDIVVVGAGSSGLSAALTAALGGAKVIVLEKLPNPGGYSLFAEGMFAAESKIQHRDYIGITKEEAFRNHMESTHWSANGRLVRVFIDRSPDTIDWFMGMGIEYPRAITLWPGGPRTWHMMKGGGKALIETLVKKVMENGVQLLTDTPAVKLIKDDKNRISGVMAINKESGELRIDAKAVIISAGSYANNPEMVKKYKDLPFEATSIVPMGQTGEHIEMAWEAGAASDGMGVFMAIPAVPGERPHSHLWAAAIQPLLWINQMGERFCDESLGFYFPIAANALSKQKGGVMYTVFDEITKKRMMEQGIDASLGVYVPVTTRLDKLDEQLEKGISEGKAYAANSLKDLAKQIGVDPEALKNTVDRINEFYEERQDKVYAKDNRYLCPVKKGKFYAVKSTYHIFTTLGGIKINHEMEVQDGNLETIPGLYATGNCAGGMYGWDYDIHTTGGALGFAVNSGRIAAENGLKYIGK